MERINKKKKKEYFSDDKKFLFLRKKFKSSNLKFPKYKKKIK